MSFDLLEAQRNQCQHRVVHLLLFRRQRPLRAAGFPRAGRADLVLQFHDNALRGFLADAGDLRQGLDVAGGDGAAKGRRIHAAQNVQSDLRADAADGVDEQPEQFAFRRRHEAVEHMRVLAHRQMREQFHRATRRRQFIVGGKRYEHFVADAMNRHGDLGRQRFDQFALKKRDHRLLQAKKSL